MSTALRVAPLAGAWIEMKIANNKLLAQKVAPLAGAWIEIARAVSKGYLMRSLPSRERGLKSLIVTLGGRNLRVAPLAGAWIEIT